MRGPPITFSVRPTPAFPPINQPPRRTGVFWSRTASHADYALSANDLTATKVTNAANGSQAQANTVAASGYFETKGTTAMGLVPSGAANNTWVGFVANSIGYHSGGTIWRNNVNFLTYATYTLTDTVMCCLKLVGATLYAFFGVNGVWQSGTDPSAGTGGIDVTALFSSAVPAVSANNVGDALAGTFTASSLSYAIPAGVTAWDGTSSTLTKPVGLSTVAFLFSNDAAAFSKLEGFLSSSAAGYAEAAALSRVRAFISSITEAWSENSVLVRLRSIIASSSAIFSESTALTRVRQLGAAVGIVFAEGASFIRLRQLLASASIVFAESSVLSRLRASVSSASAAFAETAVLARLRSLTAQASAIFGEASVLARLRAFVSSRAAVFSESSSISRLQKLIAAGAAVWAESAVLTRIRNIAATATEIWSEVALLARLRSVVASAVQAFSESGILGRTRGFVANSAASWTEASILTRLRGFNAAGATQWAEVSAIVRKRSLAGASGSIWNGLAKFAGTGLTSAAAFGFAEAAGLNTVRGFVSSAGAVFLESSILSSTTIFIPHGPTFRFTRDAQPFPPAARENRNRSF